MNNILQGLGGVMQGAGPAGAGLYNSTSAAAGLISPESMHQLDVQAARRQMAGNPANLNLRQQIEQANAYSQAEQAKKALTGIIAGLAGQSSGRNVPAHNQHEQQGRTGLVDPSLTGQGTALPIPFNRQWDLAANLQAYVSALPPHMLQINEQVRAVVDTTVPNAQRALKQPHTIYEKVPSNFMTNRINLALQRKREQSIYAVV